MPKVKFVQVDEIVKPGKYADKFVGVELSRSGGFATLLCVSDRNWEDIDIQEVEIEKYKFKVTDRDRVHYLFSVALKSKFVDVTKAEIELLYARRNLKFHENKIKTLFKKPLSIGDIPDYQAET